MSNTSGRRCVVRFDLQSNRGGNASGVVIVVVEFATPTRNPHGERIVVVWPNEVPPALLSAGGAFVILAHDAKM